MFYLVVNSLGLMWNAHKEKRGNKYWEKFQFNGDCK